MIGRIKEIISYRDMVGGLVKRDLRGRYKGSILGFLWNFLNPMCQIVVYIVVFSMIFRSGIDNYYAYLIIGMMPWNFFAEAVREGAGCIVHQADMVKKIYFPREILAISAVTSRFINFLITYIVVFVIILVTGVGISIKPLIFLPFMFVTEYFFSLGLTLLLAGIDVYFRDIEHIIGVLLMAWVWGTPVMYAMEATGDGILGKVVSINPMTWFINAYHNILFDRMNPDSQTLLKCFIAAVVLMLIGEIVFIRLGKNFAEEL